MVTCAYAGGKIYGYVTKGYSKFNYIVIDEKSQHVDYWGRTNLLFPRSMAYDYSTNTLYAIAYTSQSSSKNALYKVDIDTGDLTKIADLHQAMWQKLQFHKTEKCMDFHTQLSMKSIRPQES